MSVAIRQLSTSAADFDAEFERLKHWSAETDDGIEQTVAAILADVRVRGDAAVLEYTRRFDGVAAEAVAELEISQAQLQAALASIPSAQRNALEAAAGRVQSFHERGVELAWDFPKEPDPVLFSFSF